MNLIVCASPLQVLIAEKIIEKYSNDSFYGIMIMSNNNDKFNYYYKKLKTKCDRGCKKIFLSNSFKKNHHLYYYCYYIYIIVFVRIALFFRKRKVKNVFTSSLSIDTLFIQIVLSQLSPKVQFFSFDDGTVNIGKNGYTYTSQGFIYENSFLRKLLGLKLSISQIISRITKHYTIYPNVKNLMENTEPIHLMNTNNSKDAEKGEQDRVSILLGQPIYEHLENAEKEYIDLVHKVMRKYHIDLYFPHPRENTVIQGIKYVETPLIVEDYILSNFKDYAICLYTFYSSAALNFRALENIRITAIKPKNINIKHLSIYTSFEDFGIKIVEM